MAEKISKVDTSKITYQPLTATTPNKLEEILNSPGVLSHHTDALLEIDYNNNWGTPNLKPYYNLSLDPATSALHYGQSVFEGVKVYLQKNGQVAIFRPYEHGIRFGRSAKRIGLPSISPQEFLDLLTIFVKSQLNWLPSGSEMALYLRPLIFASSPSLLLKKYFLRQVYSLWLAGRAVTREKIY